MQISGQHGSGPVIFLMSFSSSSLVIESNVRLFDFWPKSSINLEIYLFWNLKKISKTVNPNDPNITYFIAYKTRHCKYSLNAKKYKSNGDNQTNVIHIRFLLLSDFLMVSDIFIILGTESD